MSALSPDMMRRLLLRQPTRSRVFDAVRARPGTHVRSLARDLGLALGTVEHHVRQLERHGLVFAYQAGRRRSLFVQGEVTVEDAPFLHALAKPLWAEIVQALLEHEAPHVRGLAAILGESPAVLSHHLGRLREQGLVERHQVGREAIYILTDPERVRRHLPPAPGFLGLVQRAAMDKGSTETGAATDRRVLFH